MRFPVGQQRFHLDSLVMRFVVSKPSIEMSILRCQEPDMVRLVLQASVTALVNLQSVEAVDAEKKRRAVKGN